MDVHQTLLTVAAIFTLFLVGYLAKRLGALKAGDATVVNSIVINITMPAYIFVYTHERPLTTTMIRAPVLVCALEIVIMGVAYLAARAMRLDRRTTGALIVVAAFGNTGFLGYPVVDAAFRHSGVAVLSAVMIDQFGMALILYTIGVSIATAFAGSKFEWGSLLQFAKTPLFPATVVALALRKVPMPDLVMSTLDYLAVATVPLVMISMGLTLSAGPVRQYPGALVVTGVLKLAVMPALAYLLLPMFGISGVVGKVTVLECAMPSAVFTGIIAARFGANGAFAAGAIFLTTLASVAVLPCVLLLTT